MSNPVPVDEWTDDEWLRTMRECPPSESIDTTEAKVGRWREEATVKEFVKEQKKEFQDGYGT